MDEKSRLAQRFLTRLGYLATDYTPVELDAALRAALNRFQQLHALALTSEPDDPTLVSLEAADSAGECLLLGEVVDNTGPVADASIDVRDRDIGPSDSWPTLVPGVAFSTDANGRFQVRYSLDQVAPGDWPGRDKAYVPDLVFELSQQPVAHEGFDIIRLPATEPVSKDEQRLGIQARRLEEVRLVLNTASRRRQAGDSEFEQLLADFTNTFGQRERTPDTLDEAQQEVSFVARELDRPFDRVDALRLAFKISGTAFAFDVGPEIVYAIIRTRGITTVYGLATSTKDDLVAALTQAVAELIIGPIDDERIGRVVELILRLAPGKALDADGPEGGASRLQQVLQHVLPDAEEQTDLIRRFGQSSGDTAAFWTSLAQVPAFAAEGKIRSIQFTLQLDRLTGSNLPLMAALQQDGQGVKSTRQLLELGEQGLLDLMNQHEIAAPEGTAGTNPLEQRKNHAADIVGALHLALPTASVAKILNDAPHLIDSDEVVSGAVRQFLSLATSDERRDAGTAYDIRTTRLSQYLEQHGSAAFAGVDPKVQEKAIPHLQRAQRLFKLSTGPESFKALFSSSLGSAHAIAQIPRLAFLAQWGEQVGKLDAMMIHARAQSTSASALQVYVTLRDALSGVQPCALDLINSKTATPPTLVINAELREAAAPLLKAVPNWQSLFGPQELCECKHCRSVLSPAAYLVDLLHFLDGPPNKDGFTALDVLIGREKTATQPERLGRRPDIAQLKLSCENTNTSLPYVDLVNEVLESLAQAYANATLAVEAPIFDNQSVPARDTGDATTAELQANPQYSIAGAYAPATPTPRKAIDAAIFPAGLPYNQPLATARVYLNHLGVPLADLIEALSPAAATSPIGVAEALQLAPLEIDVLTGAVTVDELYGLTPELLPTLKKSDSGLWVAALKRLMNIEGAGLALARQAADEVFDDSCLAAVKAYQTAHGMVVTGEVKHLAWEALLTLTPPLRSMLLPAPRELIRRLGIDYEELGALLQLPSINPAIPALRAVTKTLALPKADLMAFITAGFTAPSAELLKVLAAGGATEAGFTAWAREQLAGANWDAFLSTALLEVPETDPCNLDLVRLRRWEESKPDLDDSFWLRLAGFVRLSRRLGWPFAELDTVLRSLGAIELSVKVLEQLVQINKLKARLQLSLPELVELWAPPDVVTTGSPYAKRFLSRAALRIDPVFASDWKGQVLAEADRPDAARVTIAAHTPALLAGFRLAASELAEILTDAGLTPATSMTLEVLSQITRRATLARAMGLKATELNTLTALIRQGGPGPDLFQPPARTWTLLQLVEAVGLLSSVNLSVSDLGGIYLERGPSVSAAVELFAMVLPQLEEGFAQIAANSANEEPEPAVGSAPIVDPLLAQLGFVVDDSTTAQAVLAAMDGTSRQSVPLAGAPIIPAPIDKRLSFQPEDPTRGITEATLNLRGRLTETEVAQLKALPTLAGFHEAVDELARAADVPIRTLLGRFKALGQLSSTAEADAIGKLLTTPSLDSEGKADPIAAKNKRAYLAALLSPIVMLARQRTLVKNVLSKALKLPPDVTAVLLEPAQASDSALLGSVRAPLAPMIEDFTAVATAAAATKAPLKPADLPDAAAAFTRLSKASAVINATGLSKDELAAVHGRWVDFNTLPVAATTDTTPFADVLRLAAFIKLKTGWRSTKLAPAAVLGASDLASAADVLALGAGRPAADILAVVGALGWSLADLQDPHNLLRLTRVLEMVKRLGVSAEAAIAWTMGPITPDLADQIKRATKAKYSDEAWFTISPPLADAIRESSRAALVAYLLPRLHLQNSNQLYQTLLIDVETAPVALTSRVKQAISSVQLFIQRSLLNLEPDVPPSLIDRTQWNWMQRYRVWEANRKVFLYPHAYLRPELRDDKTPFFKELESDLLQGELTNESCERALSHYLEKLHTVAKLEIGGMCIQDDFLPDELNKEVVHLFGRTANVPNRWFYRRYEVSRNDVSTWTPWEEVPLDIQGDRVAPAVWNRRLYLFWPMVTDKTTVEGAAYREFQLAWSERSDGKWASKKVSRHDNPIAIHGGLGMPRQLYVGDIAWRHEQPTPTEMDISAPAIWLGGQRVAAQAIGEDGQTRANPVVDQAPRPAVFFPKDFPSSSINLPGTQPPLKGAYGYSFTRDSFARHFEGQGFTHDADFAFRSCHDAVSLYQIGWRRFVTGYALRSAANGLSVKHLSERATQTVQILSGGVGRLTEPFYVHGAHSYFCAEGGARSLFGTMNQGAGSILRSLSAPAALEALIAPSAKTVPVDPAAREANPTSGVSIGQFGRDRATLTNAWLSAAAEAPVASKDGAPAKTSILKTASLNTASALDDSPKIDFETLAHPFVCQFSEALARYGVPGLLRPSTQDLKPLLSFAVLPFNAKVVREPYPEDRVDFGEGRLSQPIRSTTFSAYNWELFFHIPTLLADRLLQSNHFEEALRMLRYVFDPTDGEGGYWKFKPFASVCSSVRLENVKSLLASIQKAASDSLKQLAEWRDHPFQPHLLARHRTSEYMKFVVLKMIDICLKAGDYYFRQDTIECIEIARLYYVMAADLLGRRPLKVPAPGQSVAKSFAELRDAELDGFGNALMALENELPFYNDASTAAIEEGSTVLGMSRSAYFGIPQDDTLLAQWDLVADRLFKIRHSMNIEGIARQLALFEPPIDPMLLVQAAARGVDINSVVNDLSAPMPAYRFSYMMQRALEMCSEVKGLGSSLLSAIEKKDGEHLALLRSSHEIDMLRLIREVKAQQVDELEKQRLVNQTLLDSALLAVNHYEQLIAAQLIDQERLHLSYLDEANDWQGKAGVADTLASYLHLFPQIAIKPVPPPVPEISVGGMQLGTYMNTVARFFSFMGGQASYQANVKSISGGHARREQEWTFMLDRARLEKTQQERQLAALDIRIAIANLELSNHDKQIEHATEIDDFLRRQKFTNQDLYAWMESKIAAVYYQSYQLAYELAKKAERAYRFELGLTNSDFIKFGSWDSQRKGLMAGEQLALQLRQMERAHHEANKREYEVTKHVSLLSLDPMALIRLKEEGTAQFALPEALFDMDFPGHYMRRIKSVSITLPCVTGPYASVSATLRLTKSRIRYKPETAVGYAPRENDTRFLTNYAATRAVATSTGQNDAGLFELNFRDERYLPFEGEGVESLWQLEINKDYAGFDINTVSDAVLHIRYTSREGGERLKEAAKTHLSEALKSTFTTLDGKPQPLTRVFSVRHEFPEAWNELTLPVPAGATGEATRMLTLPITKERLPFFTLGRKVMPTRVTVLIAPKPDAKLPNFEVTVQDKPLSDAGTSSEATAASVVHRVWSAEGPFAQVAEDESSAWKLSLTVDASAMRSTVQRLEELVIAVEYSAAI